MPYKETGQITVPPEEREMLNNIRIAYGLTWRELFIEISKMIEEEAIKIIGVTPQIQ